MKNTETNTKTDLEVTPQAENQKGIENHKKAASHFEAAAKSHHEAAKHQENNNHDKAAKSTLEAHGHSSLGYEVQKADIKKHATKG